MHFRNRGQIETTTLVLRSVDNGNLAQEEWMKYYASESINTLWNML